MITYSNLFESICSFENLLSAAQKAQKGKRFQQNVALFNFNLEKELLQLRKELLDGTYLPGKYRQFTVYESKKRLISAAPYRDRVVHHAICNIIEPLFEKTFIYDSYANRKNKGTHKAIQRFTEYCRKNRYVLKCDIRDYFGSIDRVKLLSLVARKLRDNKTLRLIKEILDNSPCNMEKEGNRKTGLPIGNLMSQFFANLYLNGFDHFIKEELQCSYYIRYVDDFVILDNDMSRLHLIKNKIEEYLSDLGLLLHPGKSQAFPVSQGTDFLGFKIFPQYRLLRKSNYFHFRKKLLKNIEFCANNCITREIISRQVQSWTAHCQWGDTWCLRKKVFSDTGLSALLRAV